MKKILALAVGMLLIPFTAFGMQMMSDSDMDSITGQSGVAITVDNIQIYSSSTGGEEFWYESARTEGAVAAVGLVREDNSYSYMFINAIKAPAALVALNSTTGEYTGRTISDFMGVFAGDDGPGSTLSFGLNEKLRGDYTGLAELYENDNLAWYGPRQAPAVLTIRVVDHNDERALFGNAQSPLAAQFDGNLAVDPNGAYIEIGLGTIELYTAAGSQDVLSIYVLGGDAYTGDTGPIGSGSFDYSLGTIYTTDSGATTAILGGRIGISSFGQMSAGAAQETDASLGKTDFNNLGIGIE